MSSASNKVIAAVSAAAVACALVPSPTLAGTEPAASSPNIRVLKNTAPRVSFADLDLTSLPGQKMLVQRVKGAVRVACKDVLVQPADPLTDAHCRAATWSNTRPQVNRAIAKSHQLASLGHTRVALAAISVSVAQ
jgi:UrcA family protein